MADSETLGYVIGDNLDARLQEDVAKMRTSLSSCSDDRETSIQSLRTIRSLQIYHQITRLIKYLDMCDKIESKLYECIDCTLLQIDAEDTEHLLLLLQIQERLQRLMVESQKLLQPYLDTDVTETITFQESTTQNSISDAMDASTRDKVRIAAQRLLSEIGNADIVEVPMQEEEPQPKKKRGRKKKVTPPTS